jgi:hypothetical protein
MQVTVSRYVVGASSRGGISISNACCPIPSRGNWDEQPREIHLGQELVLTYETQRGLSHTLRKQCPGNQPRKYKDGMLEAFGVNLYKSPEYYRENQHQSQRLQYRPRGPQDRLLIAHRNIAPDQIEE